MLLKFFLPFYYKLRLYGCFVLRFASRRLNSYIYNRFSFALCCLVIITVVNRCLTFFSGFISLGAREGVVALKVTMPGATLGSLRFIKCKPISVPKHYYMVIESSRRFFSSKQSVLDKAGGCEAGQLYSAKAPALSKYDNPIDLSSEKLTKPRRIKSLKVICTETKEENSYSTIRDAAKALKVDKNLLRDYIQSYGDNNLNILFKDKYLIIVIRLKSRLSSVNVHCLPLNKWFVFHEDKKTIAFVFDNIVDVCRTLTPMRCKNLSDNSLTKNKNIQHILRVINKGVITNTEVGKFYLFKNPGYSSCLAIVL